MLLRRIARTAILLAIITGAMTTTGTTRNDIALFLPAFAQEFVTVMNGALAARRAADAPTIPAAKSDCGRARIVQRGNIRFQTAQERRC